MTSAWISEQDARSLIRLLGDVAALAEDHPRAKKRLLSGLARLIAADYWIATRLEEQPGTPPAYPECTYGCSRPPAPPSSLAPNSRCRASSPDTAASSPTPAAPASNRNAALLRRLDSLSAAVRSGSDGFFTASSPAPLVASALRLGAGAHSLIAFFRRPESPPFAPREQDLAELMLTEAAWLHAADWPGEASPAATPRLSPRSQRVLELLLEGESRKSISDQLSISVHTVSGYAKEVYGALGVRSQAELIRRFERHALRKDPS